MLLISKKLTLPILVGISLTGVCAGLLYFLYKKSDDDKVFNVKNVKKYMKVEMKVPRELVPIIIGRGGENVKDIQDRSSTRIRFATDDITQPDRICYIEGTYECINIAEVMIKNIIDSQPLIETYDIMVSQKMRALLLANRTNVLNDIQASSKAKIIVEKGYVSDPNAMRRLTIKGSAQQIATALSFIEDLMREEKANQEKLEMIETVRSPRGKATRNSPDASSKNSISPQSSEASPVTEEPLFGSEGSMEVYVSAAENPSQFWVQVVGPKATALDDLVKKMTDYYDNQENQELHLLKNITVGQMVAAKFSADGKWYRAEVTSIESDSKEYEVFFVDYGDYEFVPEESLFELRTDFLSLRLQAIECSLANVKPKNEDWSEEASDRFNELCRLAEWKVIIAKIRGFKERVTCQGISRREGSPIPYVELINKQENPEINIGKQLIIENLAVPEDEGWSAASSTVSLTKPSQEFSSSPKLTSSIPTIKISNKFTPPKDTPEDIEVVDLISPVKPIRQIEEIDLVTPNRSKQQTAAFIKSEINSNTSRNLSNIKPTPESSSDYDSDELEAF